MSYFAFPSLLFHWMLDLTLAPMSPLVLCQKIFVQNIFSPDLQLVLGGFLVVQCLQMRSQESGFGLAMRLKFQMARCLS